MERLSLREHETRPGVRLTRERLDELQRLDPSPAIEVRPTPGSPGAYDLTPGSKVGVVRLPDLTVAITPKIPIHRVMFLISYALRPPHVLGDVVDVGDADLVEAMAHLFHASVRQATHRGLLQGYQTRDEALHVVRGRIRIDDQLRRRYGLAVPIEVRYDEFTPDISANRLLKAAVPTPGVPAAALARVPSAAERHACRIRQRRGRRVPALGTPRPAGQPAERSLPAGAGPWPWPWPG